jgi:hypothetical protein
MTKEVIAVTQNGHNNLVLGSAGTGKSHLVICTFTAPLLMILTIKITAQSNRRKECGTAFTWKHHGKRFCGLQIL